MNKTINLASLKLWIATAASTLLYWVLFLCANTNSCTLVYQPEAPKNLENYKAF